MSTFTITEHTAYVMCNGVNHKHGAALTGLCECGALVIQTHTGKIVDRHHADNFMCFVQAHSCEDIIAVLAEAQEELLRQRDRTLANFAEMHAQLMDDETQGWMAIALVKDVERKYENACATVHEVYQMETNALITLAEDGMIDELKIARDELYLRK
jgi:hypothetical protein